MKKKAVYSPAILTIALAVGVALISSAQGRDCPDCPKTVIAAAAAPAGTPGPAGPVASPGQSAQPPAVSSSTGTSLLDPDWRRFAPPPMAPGERPDCHRVQVGKQDCAECHKKETPGSYQQWLGSKHGINNVKCGICHGDINNYRARPDKVVCMGCHSAQVSHMPEAAQVTNCSFCHKGHWFTVHKIAAYEKFGPGRDQRFKVPGF